jgi:hypothetical protein
VLVEDLFQGRHKDFQASKHSKAGASKPCLYYTAKPGVGAKGANGLAVRTPPLLVGQFQVEAALCPHVAT